jgi:hypothetical protein
LLVAAAGVEVAAVARDEVQQFPVSGMRDRAKALSRLGVVGPAPVAQVAVEPVQPIRLQNSREALKVSRFCCVREERQLLLVAAEEQVKSASVLPRSVVVAAVADEAAVAEDLVVVRSRLRGITS